MEFIYGTQTYQISQILKTKKNHFKGIVVEFDANSSYQEIVSLITTVPMLEVEKLIIIRNHECFQDKILGQKLVQLLSTSNQPTYQFIFILESNLLQRSQPLINYLFQQSKVHKIENLTDKNVATMISSLVQEKGGTISNAAILKLIMHLPLDLWIIASEIDKLLLKNKNIQQNDVEELTSKYIKDDFFSLSKAILDNDKRTIVESYQNRINLGDDTVYIIYQISQILELAIKVDYYRYQGLTNYEINQKSGIHIFRVKQGQTLIEKIGIKQIKELLLNLANLDLKIKQGKVDKKLGLEQFILQLLK